MKYSSGVIEMLGLYNKTTNALIVGLYRQPDDVKGGNRSTPKEFKAALSKLRTLLISQENPAPETLLCGDFNLPNAVWPQGLPADGCPKEECEMIEALLELTNEFFLNQNIMTSTHQLGNTLNLLFSNNLNFLII